MEKYFAKHSPNKPFNIEDNKKQKISFRLSSSGTSAYKNILDRHHLYRDKLSMLAPSPRR